MLFELPPGCGKEFGSCRHPCWMRQVKWLTCGTGMSFTIYTYTQYISIYTLLCMYIYIYIQYEYMNTYTVYKYIHIQYICIYIQYIYTYNIYVFTYNIYINIHYNIFVNEICSENSAQAERIRLQSVISSE